MVFLMRTNWDLVRAERAENLNGLLIMAFLVFATLTFPWGLA